MTEEELLVTLDDYFGDWIDGDDFVTAVGPDENGNLLVRFESGAVFCVSVEKL